MRLSVRAIVLLAITVGLVGGGVVQVAQEAALGRQVQLAQGSLSFVREDAARQSVGFGLIGGTPTVRVELAGGDAPLTMLLDTGAPTTISEEFASRLSMPRLGAVPTISVDAREVVREVVSLPSVAVGDAVFTGAGALTGFTALDLASHRAGVDGMVGANLMDGAVWQLDYGSRRLTLARTTAGLDHVAGAWRIPFVRASAASPSPIIELGIGRGVARLLVDTGSDGGITVNPQDLEGSGVELAPDAPASRTVAMGSAGPFEAGLAWSTADVQLGDHTIHDLPIATSDALPPGLGNVGSAFLEQFVPTIDWTEDVLYLDPLGGDPRSTGAGSAGGRLAP